MSRDLNPNPPSPQLRDAPSSAIMRCPASQAGSLFVPPPSPDDALRWVPGPAGPPHLAGRLRLSWQGEMPSERSGCARALNSSSLAPLRSAGADPRVPGAAGLARRGRWRWGGCQGLSLPAPLEPLIMLLNRGRVNDRVP